LIPFCFGFVFVLFRFLSLFVVSISYKLSILLVLVCLFICCGFDTPYTLSLLFEYVSLVFLFCLPCLVVLVDFFLRLVYVSHRVFFRWRLTVVASGLSSFDSSVRFLVLGSSLCCCFFCFFCFVLSLLVAVFVLISGSLYCFVLIGFCCLLFVC
jgi:hypothetical protein